MEITKSQDIVPGKKLSMIVYGKPGSGVTSFCASIPNVLILDFERGTRFLGKRGYKDVAIVNFDSWITKKDIQQLEVLLVQYDVVVMDSLGEAMKKLIADKHFKNEMFREKNGSLSVAGWQEVKTKMRGFITWLYQQNKTIIIAAHAEEYISEAGRDIRIQVETNLRNEIPNVTDMICYISVQRDEGEAKRIMQIPAQGSSFDSKGRPGDIPLEFDIGEKTGWADFSAVVFGEEEEATDAKK